MDINKAKEMLSGDIRCVIVKDNNVFTSEKRGIAPVLEAAESGLYQGCIAADKIVGKAAALLYADMKATEVYASVLSKAAIPVLIEHNIKYGFGTLCEFIRNRSGDGMCPMEMTVKDISCPQEAKTALRNKLEALKRGC